MNTNTQGAKNKAKRRLSKKLIVIIAVAAAAALLAVFLVTQLTQQTAEEADKSTFYVETEGYEFHAGIGDAVALFSKPGAAEPVIYQGVKIIQACNLLPIGELRELGLKTRAYQTVDAPGQATFAHTYFDAQGQGTLLPAYPVAPEGNSANNCSYPLASEGRLVIDVYQPPYVPLETIVAELSHYTKIEPVGEVNVYEQALEGTEDGKAYIIGKDDTGLRLEITGVPADQHQKVIKKLAANFTKQRAAPAGPPEFYFESPLIKAPYAEACELLPAAVVEQLFQAKASPLVTQSFGYSVGVSKSSESGLTDNSVETLCERRVAATTAEEKLAQSSVALYAESFTKPEAAASWVAFVNSRLKDKTALEGLADQAFYLKEPGGHTLYVQQGRFSLVIVLNDGLAPLQQQQLSDEKAIKSLRSLAEVALPKLPS